MIYDICELENKKGSNSDIRLAHILYDSDTKEFLISRVDKGIPLTEEV